MYNYFERTIEIDNKRFPSFNELKSVMSSIGFSNITIELVEKVRTSKSGSEILDDHFLDKRGASQLTLLSDDEYQAGMDKIKSDIQKARQTRTEISFDTNLNFYAINGIKR